MKCTKKKCTQMHSLRKIPRRLRGTNFCTSSARFATSFVTRPNCPKCTQIVRNTLKHQFRVRWGGSGAFVAKNSNTTSCQIVRNAKKNISLGSNGVDRVRSLRKIPTRLRGPNFCTSSARFAPSFVTRPNCPKCTQIVRNAPKHQFRVQWGGSGAFVAKNSDATSWHDLLH